jgi:hypothetical protein
MQRLDRLADRTMQAAAPCRAQFVVQRHPDQVVGELVTSFRRLLDDMRGDAFVQSVQQAVVGGPPRGVQQQVEREVPADHRGEPKHVVARCRQQIEAPADDLLHAFGDAHRRRQRRQRCAEHTLLLQEPHDLAEEERIPLGLRVQGRSEPRRRPRPGRRGDELVHLLRGQAGQMNASRVRHPRQTAKRVRQRMPA